MVVGQQEPAVHGRGVPGGDLPHPLLQGHVPFPEALADAAAVHHKGASVPSPQYDALPIFHIEKFHPLHGFPLPFGCFI